MMARPRLPFVSESHLFPFDEEGKQLPSLRVGSDAWYHWLAEEQHRSFPFKNAMGIFTVRRERQRHGLYWYAYHKREGKLHKTYLGKNEEVTLERLNKTAAIMSGRSEIDGKLASPSSESEKASSEKNV